VNRRRLIAATFFSVVILAVLGVIVGAEVVSSGATVSVMRLRTDVQQGAAFSSSDVEVIQLRIDPGDLNDQAPGSVPPGARYALSLQAGDLLAPDDLVSGDAEIPVTLTLTDPPPLATGEAVDLFASVPESDTEVLIGHDLAIEQVNADSVTLLVSSQQELAWLEIVAFNSDLKLYALASVGAPPSGLAPDDVDQAICELAPAGCPELTVPTPPGTPAPAPAASAAATSSR